MKTRDYGFLYEISTTNLKKEPNFLKASIIFLAVLWASWLAYTLIDTAIGLTIIHYV